MNSPTWYLIRWSPFQRPLVVRANEAQARNLSTRSLLLVPALVAIVVVTWLAGRPDGLLLTAGAISLGFTLILSMHLIFQYRHLITEWRSLMHDETLPELSALRPFIRVMWLLAISPFVALAGRFALQILTNE